MATAEPCRICGPAAQSSRADRGGPGRQGARARGCREGYGPQRNTPSSESPAHEQRGRRMRSRSGAHQQTPQADVGPCPPQWPIIPRRRASPDRIVGALPGVARRVPSHSHMSASSPRCSLAGHCHAPRPPAPPKRTPAVAFLTPAPHCPSPRRRSYVSSVSVIILRTCLRIAVIHIIHCRLATTAVASLAIDD